MMCNWLEKRQAQCCWGPHHCGRCSCPATEGSSGSPTSCPTPSATAQTWCRSSWLMRWRHSLQRGSWCIWSTWTLSLAYHSQLLLLSSYGWAEHASDNREGSLMTIVINELPRGPLGDVKFPAESPDGCFLLLTFSGLLDILDDLLWPHWPLLLPLGDFSISFSLHLVHDAPRTVKAHRNLSRIFSACRKGENCEPLLLRVQVDGGEGQNEPCFCLHVHHLFSYLPLLQVAHPKLLSWKTRLFQKCINLSTPPCVWREGIPYS